MTADREAQDVAALVEVLDGTYAYHRGDRGIVVRSIAQAEAILASDWLAACERAAGEKARADERERIALAIEAVPVGPLAGAVVRPILDRAARIARSQP